MQITIQTIDENHYVSGYARIIKKPSKNCRPLKNVVPRVHYTD